MRAQARAHAAGPSVVATLSASMRARDARFMILAELLGLDILAGGAGAGAGACLRFFSFLPPSSVLTPVTISRTVGCLLHSLKSFSRSAVVSCEKRGREVGVRPEGAARCARRAARSAPRSTTQQRARTHLGPPVERHAEQPHVAVHRHKRQPILPEHPIAREVDADHRFRELCRHLLRGAHSQRERANVGGRGHVVASAPQAGVSVAEAHPDGAKGPIASP